MCVCAPNPLLKPRPLFNPHARTVRDNVGHVQSLLSWAFHCSTPPQLYSAVAGSDSDAAGSTVVAASVQWNYSIWHLCTHMQAGITRFQIEDDGETEAILLEATSVHECPGELHTLGKWLPPDEFRGPRMGPLLGAVPLLRVILGYRFGLHCKEVGKNLLCLLTSLHTLLHSSIRTCTFAKSLKREASCAAAAIAKRNWCSLWSCDA